MVIEESKRFKERGWENLDEVLGWSGSKRVMLAQNNFLTP